MKIKLQGVQNPFQKQLQSDTASEEAFEFQFFEISKFFDDFWIPNRAKIEEKMLKMRCLKTMLFWIDFYWRFLRFGLRKWNENSLFVGSLSKKLILWKSLFFHKKIAIFLVLSLQKSTKFRCQNAFENDIEKKGSRIEFGHWFWLPKTTKIAPKRHVKRSLFCDAMELARKSSKINGRRRL